MALTKNFIIQEFVYPELFDKYGEKSQWFIDKRIVQACQFLRDKLDRPIKINDWHDGGHYHESGLRMFDTETGAKFSQHKFGAAADLKIGDLSGEEMRDVVKRYWADLKGLISTIEDDTNTWLHIDCRWTFDPDTLFIVPNPNKSGTRDRGLETPNDMDESSEYKVYAPRDILMPTPVPVVKVRKPRKKP
jgi:hypothetical protein